MKETILFKPQKMGRGNIQFQDQSGNSITLGKAPSYSMINKSIAMDEWIECTVLHDTYRFRLLKGSTSPSMNSLRALQIQSESAEESQNEFDGPSHEEVLRMIKDAPKVKPRDLKISDIRWKYLYRSVLRGKNIMMTGPSGTGKTVTVQKLVKALNRKYFYFNLGATQDPRSTLIGNTHFEKGSGTVFTQSLFVKAIQRANSVILLDEITRAHPEAWNILMTVLDPSQRYLRLDEDPDSKTIQVASGVTFIATANIGHEYTSTRQLDRAITDRFTIIEMEPLGKDDELDLLQLTYPDVSSEDLSNLADLASYTREIVKEDTGVLTTIISTRMTMETASLLQDGFSLLEASEISILPFFSNDGGLQSERTHIKQFMEKWSTPMI